MDRQMEREYKEALDSLCFSGEGKEHIMKKLIERQESTPAKRRGVHPLRTGLIAAALCAALLGTAGAATVIAYQANIHFFDGWNELWAGSADGQTDDGVAVGMVDNTCDYGEVPFMGGGDFWWNGEDEPDQTLLEELPGADGDGWTAKRMFRLELNGQTYLDTRYKAAALSGFDGLWNGWDTAWLEEHYTTVPGHALYSNVEAGRRPYRTTVTGEFQGQSGAIFTLTYSWFGDTIWDDENFLTTNLDHTETYTTADGVDAAITTATSPSGKTLFWVSVISGHSRFSMEGTQVELDGLHGILDSLNLSALLKYTPEQ